MSYRNALTGLGFFISLVLLTLVDIRRGFLFAAYPIRSVFFVLHPVHGVMLAIGIAGIAVSYRALCVLENEGAPGVERYVAPLTFVILALLVVDLFTYRGVPAARSIAAG